MKSRFLIIISLLMFFSSSSVYAVPFVNDDDLIDNLKQNQLPIGQGIYMNFTVFLMLLSGGVAGTIFAIKKIRK